MTAASRTLTTAADLVRHGLASAERAPALEAVAARYAVAVTPAMVALIDPDDPADPIARQFVPQPDELETREVERADPIGDDPMSPVPGLVHRYPDRALLKLVSICPVYCRFCFRREMVGPGGPGVLSEAELDVALGYVADHPEIWELVISGGDPLIVSPRRMAALMARLAAIPHVKVVRFHTRVPVVSPERVTPELVDVLRGAGKTVYVVLHTNHAREFSAAARQALALLADGGIPLLGQSVLLKGVNDDPAALEALLRTCVENRVKPYYLHHADLAPGTAHMRTSLADGQDLMRTLRGRLSGIAQPVYVLDIPGGHGKVPVGPVYLCDAPHDVDGPTRVVDPHGTTHPYPPR